MNHATILQAIRELPPEEQEELLQEMLAILSVAEEPTATPNSSRLAGIFSNGRMPPTDDQVAQWLDEHRQEKYGQH